MIIATVIITITKAMASAIAITEIMLQGLQYRERPAPPMQCLLSRVQLHK